MCKCKYTKLPLDEATKCENEIKGQYNTSWAGKEELYTQIFSNFQHTEKLYSSIGLKKQLVKYV